MSKGQVRGGVLPVSVVIAAYNRAAQLGEALDSVAGQSAPAAEVIVVDDGSVDRTASVARSMGARVIQLPENSGSAAARNAGVQGATQPWIAFLDSDDRWLPHHLATIFSLTDGHLVAAGSLFSVVERGRGRRIRVDGPWTRRARVLRDPRALYPENPIVLSASLVRRDALLRVGGFETRFRFSEDLDLWLRLLEHGTAVVSPRVVVRYGVHPEQKTRNNPELRKNQVAIIQHRAGSWWWRPRYVEWNRAARGWDAARSSFEQGRRAEGFAELREIAVHPGQLTGLMRILLIRRLKHRRFASVDASGAPVIGILPGTSGSAMTGLHPVADLRAPTKAIWELLFRPPAALLAARGWHRLLARILRVPVIDSCGH